MTSFTTLITPAELRALAAPLILDCRFDLADPAAGRRAYAAGHIPGAHYLHLDDDLAGPKTGADGVFHGRHPLPAREAFAARLRALGLTAGRQVVCLDTQGGPYAARAWWMLRWLGHAEVAVLDGAWDGELVTGLPAAAPDSASNDWQPGAPLTGQVDAATLLSRLGRVRLIDARAPERFRGEVEPLDKQAGHIPGASNRLFKDNLAADGRFKPREQLRAEFEALLAPYPGAEVVHQCGSGVTACHNLLAMAHAGLGEPLGGRLYPGSWSEWSADASRPVATG
jgi:thiosulfate/3-mercaptopyruvate sulfurtransferase